MAFQNEWIIYSCPTAPILPLTRLGGIHVNTGSGLSSLKLMILLPMYWDVQPYFQHNLLERVRVRVARGPVEKLTPAREPVEQ